MIKSKRMRWAGHVARMENRNMYRLLVGKADIGWWIILRMDLGEKGWGDADWIGLAHDRDGWRALVNVVMNLWIP
jgi:hypothetical protein